MKRPNDTVDMTQSRVVVHGVTSQDSPPSSSVHALPPTYEMEPLVSTSRSAKKSLLPAAPPCCTPMYQAELRRSIQRRTSTAPHNNNNAPFNQRISKQPIRNNNNNNPTDIMQTELPEGIGSQ